MDPSDIAPGGRVPFRFGDSEELSDLLIGLIRAGKKTATCEALRAFESGAEVMPEVGRRDVALNWDGTPALLLETVSFVIRRFCDVDWAFAALEGENDDLAGWRHDHEQYYRRTGGFDPHMPVVCECFEVVHDYASSAR